MVALPVGVDIGDDTDRVFFVIIISTGRAIGKHNLILVDSVFEAEILTPKTGDTKHFGFVKGAADAAFGTIGLSIAQSGAFG